MSYYDVKIYDVEGSEEETIRGLSEAQKITVVNLLNRLRVKHLVKQLGQNLDVEGELPSKKGQYVKFIDTSDSSKQHLVGKTGVVMHQGANYTQVKFDDGTSFEGSQYEPENGVWMLLTNNLRVTSFKEPYHH